LPQQPWRWRPPAAPPPIIPPSLRPSHQPSPPPSLPPQPPLITTLHLVLSNDTWADAVGAPDAAGLALAHQLIGGLRSAQHEPHGWNAVEQPALTPDDLSRLSDTELRLVIPASARRATPPPPRPPRLPRPPPP
jgi:hypothetical protein